MDSSECKLLTRPSLSLSRSLRFAFAPTIPDSFDLPPPPLPAQELPSRRKSRSLAHLLGRWKMETNSKVLNGERGLLGSGSVSLDKVFFFSFFFLIVPGVPGIFELKY